MPDSSEKYWKDSFVRDAAGLCLDLLATVSQTDYSSLDAIRHLNPQTPPTDHSRLIIERERFRIWAANAAAFAEGRRSLDYRLRELPDELDQIISLLGIISSRLQSYKVALDNEIELAGILGDQSSVHAGIDSTVAGSVDSSRLHSQDDPAIETDETPSEVKTPSRALLLNYDEVVEAIHTSIDWLHRICNLLRKASVVNQNLHAQSYQLPNVDGEGLRKYFSWVVHRDFPGLSEQLKGRMARTMVERHRRVLYRRERYGAGWKQEGLYHREEKKATDLPQPTTNLDSLSPNFIDPNARITAQEELGGAPLIKDEPSLYSKGAVTEPDRSRYYAPSSIATGRSAALDYDAELLVPPPPPSCRGEPNFTCDLCCMILDSRIGTDHIQWIKHVKQDLDAYVCLFDRCDHPFDIFSTTKEWLNHMRSEHLVQWVCPAIDHGPIEFGTKEELTAHMEQAHCDTFSPELLPYMMEACRKTSDVVFEACPFCDKTPDAMETHVGHHLRYLSLKSIPWRDYGDEVEEERDEDNYLGLADNNVDRETLGQAFGSLGSGSIDYGDLKGSIASEYGGDSFLLEPEQQQEWPRFAPEPSDPDDNRQEEWGFINAVFNQHNDWKDIFKLQQKQFEVRNLRRKASKVSPSNVWFQKMDNLTSFLAAQEDERDQNYRPVRIAILDSGVSDNTVHDLPNRFIAGQNFIPDYSDWRTDSNWRTDSIGHGSRITKLIAKICPSSAFLIARVTDREKLRDDDEGHIARAINWAFKMQADIIFMGWTLRYRSRLIEDAIRRVAKFNILIFSPVSMNSNFKDVGFPANMSEVCGVFAADSKGNPSAFNPQPVNSGYNFAFTGEGIDIEEEETALTSPSIGTSIAAAVATGVAASLLDFIRQPICGDLREGPITMQDIASIFALLSGPERGGSLRYVIPWRLLDMMRKDYQPISETSGRITIRATLALFFSRSLGKPFDPSLELSSKKDPEHTFSSEEPVINKDSATDKQPAAAEDPHVSGIIIPPTAAATGVRSRLSFPGTNTMSTKNKVWFILQHNYTPPPSVEDMAAGGSLGPLSLGHIVPDPNHIADPINLDDITRFPSDMEIIRTHALNNSAVEASNKTIHSDLETYIVEPVRSYISESLQSPSVARYIQNSKSLGAWSLYMITGIMIARRASYIQDRSHTASLNLPSSLYLNGVGGRISVENLSSTEVASNNDFVFAVRLLKISKSLFSRDWKIELETKGAAF